MKNKLAENMLRFGTKNLTESQLESIQETELNEAPNNFMTIIKNNGALLQRALINLNTTFAKKDKLGQPRLKDKDGTSIPFDFKVTLEAASSGGGLVLKLSNGIGPKGIGVILELTPGMEPSQAIKYTQNMAAYAQEIMRNTKSNWKYDVNQSEVRNVVTAVLEQVKQTANVISKEIQAGMTSQPGQ